jgi:hypothetical protein
MRLKDRVSSLEKKLDILQDQLNEERMQADCSHPILSQHVIVGPLGQPGFQLKCLRCDKVLKTFNSEIDALYHQLQQIKERLDQVEEDE